MQPFTTQVVFEGTGGVCLFGYGTGLLGTPFQQSQFDRIVLKIFDMALPEIPVNGANGDTLTVADVIFNSPVTNDARCSLVTGYNFLYVTKAADLPKALRRYRFEFAMYPTGSEDPFWGVFEIPTIGLFSV
jgi:hypothetical protein